MKKIIIGGFIGFIIYKLFLENNSTNFNYPVEPFHLRNDAAGEGHFGANRNGRTHKGTDYIVKLDQSVFSPIDGKVTRIAKPYSNDNRYSGLLIENDDYQIKIFYINPIDIVGENIKKGELIGYAQSISQKYSSSMKDHIHIEVRQGNKILDPQTFFKTT